MNRADGEQLGKFGGGLLAGSVEPTSPSTVAGVGQRTGQPVELDDHKDVPGSAGGQRLAWSWSVAVAVGPAGATWIWVAFTPSEVRPSRCAVRFWSSVEQRATRSASRPWGSLHRSAHGRPCRQLSAIGPRLTWSALQPLRLMTCIVRQPKTYQPIHRCTSVLGCRSRRWRADRAVARHSVVLRESRPDQGRRAIRRRAAPLRRRGPGVA